MLRNGDPVGLRLNMAKSVQPSSAKCAVHKSFKYTSYICLNCKLFFFLVYVKGMALKQSYLDEHSRETRLPKNFKIKLFSHRP